MIDNLTLGVGTTFLSWTGVKDVSIITPNEGVTGESRGARALRVVVIHCTLGILSTQPRDAKFFTFLVDAGRCFVTFIVVQALRLSAHAEWITSVSSVTGADRDMVAD